MHSVTGKNTNGHIHVSWYISFKSLIKVSFIFEGVLKLAVKVFFTEEFRYTKLFKFQVTVTVMTNLLHTWCNVLIFNGK